MIHTEETIIRAAEVLKFVKKAEMRSKYFDEEWKKAIENKENAQTKQLSMRLAVRRKSIKDDKEKRKQVKEFH